MTYFSPYQQRYGITDNKDNDYPTNNFIDQILKRVTVRDFTSQAIDDKLLDKLFAAAQSSPTSSMFQTWAAVVLDADKKLELFNLDDADYLGFRKGGKNSDPQNYNAITTCNKFVIWCVNLNTVKIIMEECSADEDYKTEYQDIVNLIPNSLESLNYSTYQIRAMSDAFIAAQTFCLSAESMGLGTMYCGSIKSMDLRKFLNLPQYVMPLVGIAIGYPSANYRPVKPRMPQQLIVHHNTYKELDRTEIKKYNLLLRNFYKKHKMGDKNLLRIDDWFSRIISRTNITESLKHYKKLIENHGFMFW